MIVIYFFNFKMDLWDKVCHDYKLNKELYIQPTVVSNPTGIVYIFKSINHTLNIHFVFSERIFVYMSLFPNKTGHKYRTWQGYLQSEYIVNMIFQLLNQYFMIKNDYI